MKNTLYFILLVIVFGSLSLFAIEQLEEKKVESAHKNENIGVKKQDLPSSINQEDELKSNIDNLNAKQIQDPESKEVTDKEKMQYYKNKASVVEKTISEGDKDLLNDPLKESIDKFTQSSLNIINKEVFPLPLSTDDSNKNTADSQKNLQSGQKVDIQDHKLSESNTSQLVNEKKEEVASKSEEKKVKETNNDFKDCDGKNQTKAIIKNDLAFFKENEQEKKKNLQKWTKLNREPTKEWDLKGPQGKSVYKRQYDSLNEHLPTTIFVNDYGKQFFYCIKKNNLPCLRAIMGKLEKVGLTNQEILKFKNKLGDTPLIYSVKLGEVDVVRFLLLQGADLRVVNNNFQSSIDIAITKNQVDIINAIAEMIPLLSEDRKIDNKENSAMYSWAVKAKENNQSQCDKQDD